jgi:hypothetical protein
MTLPALLKSCETRSGASEAALREAEQQLGHPLPEDYKALLLESDGLEGFISEDGYVSLWSASELASLNDAYAVSDFVPGVTLVGTDGGDTGYGFRKDRDQLEYVAVPLVGMEPSAITVIGKSFLELVENLTQ